MSKLANMCPNPYFLGFHFPTTIDCMRIPKLAGVCPNPYFLGFHFPTIKKLAESKKNFEDVLILIFLDFIFLHLCNHIV